MQLSKDYGVNTGMIYVTFADQPSGVFSSQVIDVCRYLDKSFPVNLRLVAFISFRGFAENKRKIKKELPDAWVLPMIPKLSTWKFNAISLFFVCLFTGSKIILARGVLAANLALYIRKTGLVKKVCYDGRGAIAAEWNEYTVTPDKHLKKNIHELEKRAVMESDYRIAVSSRLVDYWEKQFGYSGAHHVVIPCTLNTGFSPDLPSPANYLSRREELGYHPADLVMVYSGSTAGWQSFHILEEFLTPILRSDPHHKVLFLSKPDESISRLKTAFPAQVNDRWVTHQQVQQVLSACDYGILVREPSITNQVASPTKFAEYLSAGLAVLISENIGDYSDFVRQHHCGQVVSKTVTGKLTSLSLDEKRKLAGLVMSHFTKEAQQPNYSRLISSVTFNPN